MIEKRKIAFLCHPYHRGGVTRWMADTAIAAAKNGCEVYFVTVLPAKEFFSAGGRETMVALLDGYKDSIHLIYRKEGYAFEFGSEVYRANVYSSLMRQHVPNGVPVIISDDMAVWAAAAGIADRYPMIGVLHGDQDYYYDKARKYHNQLSACICVSGRIQRTVLAKCPEINATKVAVIPCGIELPDFAPVDNNDNALNLAFIGRITDYEKRAEDLVKISSLLNKKDIAFHLDIAGNTASSAVEFTEKFKAFGCDSFVIFHGWQSKEEVQKLLNTSAILLLTSNSEGMPLVMMEALASGCAFTGTRVSGIEDYEQDPRAVDCVSVYTVGDIDDAVDKIIKIAAVPVNTRRQAARKLAEEEFSMTVCLNRYFAVTDGIQSKSLPPAAITHFTMKDALYSKAIALARYLKLRFSK